MTHAVQTYSSTNRFLLQGALTTLPALTLDDLRAEEEENGEESEVWNSFQRDVEWMWVLTFI